MNWDKIIKELPLGEPKNLVYRDYKSFANKLSDEIGADVCAFLNSGGGFILFGIDRKGEKKGIIISPEQTTIFLNSIYLNISPRALFSIEIKYIQDNEIFIIEVPAGKDVPYAYRNTIYIREEEKTGRANIDTVRDMVFRRQLEPERWERRFSNADTQSDLSDSEIRITVSQIKNSSFLKLRDEKNITMVLEDISVLKYGRLTNAGDVMFGTNPALRYPQIRSKAVCYISEKTDNSYLDMKSFEGPLVVMLDELLKFILRNISRESVFSTNNIQRIDEYIYPIAAIREGLVNAFAHRDYSYYTGGVSVSIYPQRLEIWNSGSLPDGVTIDEIGIKQISVLRNPDIAHVLYLRGFMEKLGRGSEMIRKSCLDKGLPAPKWISDKNGVKLTFYATKVTTEVATEVTTEVATEVTTEVKRVINVISGEMSRRDLQGLLDLTSDEHFRKAYIEPSLAAGVIERTIPEKPKSSIQKYRITTLGKKMKKTL